MTHPTFKRRGRSPYTIAGAAALAVLLAVLVDLLWFAPPWWAR